jgi:hypothetical protein
MGLKLDHLDFGKHRLMVFEDKVLMKLFGLKREEVTEERRNYVMSNFMMCTLYRTL